MQRAAEEWPSLTRVRSSSSRDRKKVTCETLSKVDWYSRRPYEAQHYYYSEDEIDYKKGDPATEAEEDAAEEEEEGPENEPENPGYGDGTGLFAPRLDQLLASMYGKPAMGMAIASPVREGQRIEKPLRTYPSPIPHSGGVLPHSGPIKLHVNMHMSSHSAALNNNKIPATIKASSIIPPNITGKPKPPGLNNADEPSSPEVTCLGRVRIKHRYCKEIGKLGAAAGAVDDDKKKEAAAVDNDKKQQPVNGHELRTMKLKRGKKKKAGAAERESASAQRGKMDLGKAMEVQHPAGRKLQKKRWEPVRKGKYSSAETMVELTERGSRGEAIMSSDSAEKGRKERWISRDATEHEERAKFHQGKQEWRLRETSEAGDVSLQAKFTIDLSRFSTAESQRGRGTILAKSLANLDDDGLQGYEQEIDTEFVPQVPPQNSLLLMRNSRNRENSATSSSSSSSWRGHGTRQEHVMDRTMDSRVSLLYPRQVIPNRISSSLLEVRMEKPATTASMAEQHQQIAPLLGLKMEEPSSAASMVEELQQITILQVKKNAMAHRQASLPKPPPEASLWQRRAMTKPSTLDIRNPIKQAIHQPTTR